MPRIIATAYSNTTHNNPTTFTPALPDGYAVGDLLLVYVATDNGVTGTFSTASSGWAEAVEQAGGNSRGRNAFYWKKVASVPETALTVTASSANGAWVGISHVITGVHATPGQEINQTASTSDTTSSGWTGTGTGADNSDAVPPTLAHTTVTTTQDDCLIVYGWTNAWETLPFIENHPMGNFHVAASNSSDSGFQSSCAIQTAWSYQPTAGTTTAPGYLPASGPTSASEEQSGCIVAIRGDGTQAPGYNDASVMPAKIVDKVSTSHPLGGAVVSMSGTITSIDGSSTTNLAAFPTENFYNTDITGAMIAGRYSYASASTYGLHTKDLTTSNGPGSLGVAFDWGSSLFLVTHRPWNVENANYHANMVDNAISVILWDNQGTPAYRVWPVAGVSSPGFESGDMIYSLISPTFTTYTIQTSGTLDISNIEGIGIARHLGANFGGGAHYYTVDSFILINKVKMIGGSTGRHADITDLKALARPCQTPLFKSSGEKSMTLYCPLELGGSGSSFINLSGSSIEFAGSVSQLDLDYRSHIPEDALGLLINTASGDYVNLSSALFGSPNKWAFVMTVPSSGTTLITDGMVVSNAGTIVLDDPGSALTGITFDQCDEITIGTATLDGCTFSNCTEDQYFTFDSTTDDSALSNCSFVDNPVYSIYLDPALANNDVIDLDNITFSGTGTADIRNNSGGHITINILNGGSTPTISNGSGATTTIVNAVAVTVTAVDVLGDPVQNARVYIEDTGGEIFNDLTDASGEITFSYDYTSPEPITGWVRRATTGTLYKQSLIAGTITSTGFTGTVVMIEDV